MKKAFAYATAYALVASLVGIPAQAHAQGEIAKWVIEPLFGEHAAQEADKEWVKDGGKIVEKIGRAAIIAGCGAAGGIAGAAAGPVGSASLGAGAATACAQ